MPRGTWVAVLLCSLGASLGEAQGVSIRLGRLAPHIDSELWDENLELFTIERSDFNGFIGGAELNFPIAERVELTAGIETSSATAFSMYRDFVFDDGAEIFQDLHLRTTPLTVGVRFLPLGTMDRLVPYVGGGAGFYFYEYREEGEFIDFETMDVFDDVFVEQGVAYGGYVSAGLEVALTDVLLLFGEYRRHWARGEHGDDFRGFGGFDYSGSQVSFGANFRF